MEELYINDILIELKSRSVSRTLQVNDIGDVKDRQANYSNSIKIPRTPNNIAAFEMLGITGSTTRLPYQTVDVKYVFDGIELVQGGKGVIKKTDGFFNIVIYDGNVSMTDLLGNKQLKTLDWSAHNHLLTNSTFISSFTNTDGYIYGLGRFSDVFRSTNSIIINELNASFYIHTLFKMIFEQEGYTITGDFFNNSDYKDRVTSMTIGHSQEEITSEANIYTFNHSESIDDTFTESTSKTYLFDTYTSVSDELVSVAISGIFSLAVGSDAVIRIEVNNNFIFSTPLIGVNDVNELLNVSIGDVITVTATILSEVPFSDDKIVFTNELTTEINSKNIAINIDLSKLIGDTRRIDFVKDITQRFGLVYRKVRNKKEFEFKQIKDILRDRVNVENWSNKYSDFISESYKPKYAEINNFKHLYDEDVDSFGDGEMIIDNKNIAKTKTLVTSIFKASKNIGGLDNLMQWEIEEINNEDVIIPKDDGLRIFKLLRVIDSIDYKFNSNILNTIEQNGLIPYLNFSVINYQREIDLSYLDFQAMINDYKSTVISAFLTTIDVYNVDFFSLKYIKQLGGLFYLNKIISFKSNKKTKVELIKVGESIKDIDGMVGLSTGLSSDSAIITKTDTGSMIGLSEGTSSDSLNLINVSVTIFQIGNQNLDELLACSSTVNTDVYHDGINGAPPSLNNTIYTDASATIILVGNDFFFKYEKGLSSGIIQVSSSGIVISVGTCGI